MSLMLLAIALAVLQEPPRYRALEVPPAEPATIAFRVRDEDTHAPLGDAEVRWIEVADSLRGDLPEVDLAQIDELIRDVPVLARSDALGMVRIPRWSHSLLVTARSGKRWGLQLAKAENLWGLSNGHSLPVDLRLDFDIDVQVIDVEGAEAPRVPVLLRESFASGNWEHPPVFTDTHGMAHLSHVGYALGGAYPLKDDKAVVAIGACLQPAVEKQLEPPWAPGSPILLQLPATGEVEVVAQERDGSPIERVESCSLALDAREQYDSSYLRAGQMVANGVVGNTTLFRHVGLNLELHAAVLRQALSREFEVVGRGPTKAGERVRITVQPGPELALVQGRVLDPQGKPRAGADLAVIWVDRPPREGWDPSIPPRSGRMSWRRDDMLETRYLSLRGATCVVTDAAGMLRLDTDPYEPWQGSAFQLLLEDEGTPRERGKAVLRDKPWPAGPHALGDIVLEPAPLVAAGQIVDAAGQPVAGVHVGVERWNQEPRIRAVSDSRGRFELRGFALDWKIGLQCQRPGYEFTSVKDLEPGAKNVRVVLPRVGGVRGRFKGSFGRETQVSWTETDRSVFRREASGGVYLEPDGSFVLDQIPAGHYSLAIGDRMLFARQIDVRAGEELDLGELK